MKNLRLLYEFKYNKNKDFLNNSLIKNYYLFAHQIYSFYLILERSKLKEKE